MLGACRRPRLDFVTFDRNTLDGIGLDALSHEAIKSSTVLHGKRRIHSKYRMIALNVAPIPAKTFDAFYHKNLPSRKCTLAVNA